jgi:uncharacterized protein (DUF362 family)
VGRSQPLKEKTKSMTRKDNNPTQATRREFLKAAAISGAAGVLAGCSAASPTPASTAAPTASPTSAASPTLAASATPNNTATTAPTLILRRPELLKMYPDTPSKVIHARHAAVWQNSRLNRDIIRTMLDASMVQLAGTNSALEAWAGLFSPDEKIAIKVNAFINSAIFTHPELVNSVTDSLIDAGIPAEQITIYDYSSSELTRARYTINNKKSGVQCFGSDSNYRRGYTVNGIRVDLSTIPLDCHAIINMPVLKSHMMSGITFALKNHFGTISSPPNLHTPLTENIAALNALPEIKDRTRLVVGDILEACLKHTNVSPYWRADYRGDSILVSHDPVAADTIALDILSKLLIDEGEDPEWRASVGNDALARAAQHGVGTNDRAQMELVEINL